MRAMVTSMCGNGFDESALRRANSLEDPHSDAPITVRASATYAVLLSWAGRLDESAEQMSAVRRRCMDRGAETDLIFVAYYTTLNEVWLGRYADAASVADETVERAQQLGGDHLQILAMTVQAVVGAYTGREAETRTAAVAAIELAQRCGSPRLADWASMSLGFLELSLGNYAETLVALEPLIARFDQVPGTEIVTSGYVPDAVEALVSLGRHTDADPMIDALEANGRFLDRPWMLAVGARCRSMWLAAQGTSAALLARPRRRSLTTTGCRCRSNVLAPSCCSANSSVDSARRKTRAPCSARPWPPSRSWAHGCGRSEPAPSSTAPAVRRPEVSG